MYEKVIMYVVHERVVGSGRVALLLRFKMGLSFTMFREPEIEKEM